MPSPISRLKLHAVRPGHLYVGAAPWGRDVPTLKRAGIDAVLAVLDADEPYRTPLRLQQHAASASLHVAAGVPSVHQFREGVEQLRRWRREGRVAYIHCLAGRGLAPLLAMAYVWADRPPRPGCFGLSAAIAEVLVSCPTADPSPLQLRALCDFALHADAA